MQDAVGEHFDFILIIPPLYTFFFDSILPIILQFVEIFANIFAEILASFWTFLFDFREHYDNIVFTSTFSEHFRDPSVLYHTDPVYIFLQ